MSGKGERVGLKVGSGTQRIQGKDQEVGISHEIGQWKEDFILIFSSLEAKVIDLEAEAQKAGNLQKETEKWKKLLEKSHGQLEQKDGIIKKLDLQLQQHLNQQESHSVELKQKDDLIEELNQQLQKEKGDRIKSQGQNKGQETQFISLKAEFLEKESRLQRDIQDGKNLLQKQLQDKDDEIKILNDDLSAQKEIRTQLRTDLQEERKISQQQLQHKDDEIKSLNDDLLAQKDVGTQLRTDLQEEKKLSQQQLQDKEDEITSLTEKLQKSIQGKGEEIKNLKENLLAAQKLVENKLRKEIQQQEKLLQKQLKGKEEEIQSLKDNLSAQKKTESELRKHLKDEGKLLEQTKEESDQRLSEIQNLRKSLQLEQQKPKEKNLATITQPVNANGELRKEVEARRKEIQVLKKDIERILGENEKLKNGLALRAQQMAATEPDEVKELRTMKDLEPKHQREVEQLRKDLRNKAAIEEKLKEELQNNVTIEQNLRRELRDKVNSEERFRKDFRDKVTIEEKLRRDLQEKIASNSKLEKELKVKVDNELKLKKELQDKAASELKLKEELQVKISSKSKPEKQRQDKVTSESKLQEELSNKISSESKLKEEIQQLRQEAEEARRREVETAQKREKELASSFEQEVKRMKEEAEHNGTERMEGIKREQNKILERATGFQQQARLLAQEVNDRKKKEEADRQIISEVESKLKKNQTEQSKLLKEIDSLKGDVLDLKGKLEGLERMNESLKAGKPTDDTLQKELTKKDEAITELTKKLSEQERLVISAQKEGLKMMEVRRIQQFQFPEDEAVQRVFEVQIEERQKQWAGKYAVAKIDEKKAGFGEILGGKLAKVAGEVTSLKDLCMRYEPDIIVNALLAQFIAENILQNPFFAIGKIEGDQFATNMMREYEQFLKVDDTSAQTWRHQTLQLFLQAQRAVKSSKKNIPSGELLQEFDLPSCNDLAQGFINGPAKAFLKKDEMSRRTQEIELAKVIERAVWVGLMMWRHRVKLHIRKYEDLRGLPFVPDSKEVKTHRSQTGHSRTPKKDAVMDLVVQPSVVASWDDDGQNREKVWGRAVVLWY